MELKGSHFENCRTCHKTYAVTPLTHPKYCPTCREAYENKFKIARDYLYSHRGATASQIAQHTGLPTELILAFVSDDRFSLSP